MCAIKPVVAFTLVVAGISFLGHSPAVPADEPPEYVPSYDPVREISIEEHSRLRADRKITPRELAWLHEKCDFIVSQHRYIQETEKVRIKHDGSRGYSAIRLGAFGHKYAIPAFLAVLRDEADDPNVRCSAVIGLSMIADARAVEALIDALASPAVADQAAEQLIRMTGVAIGFRRSAESPRTPEQYLALQKEWRAWWKEHANEVEVQRGPGRGRPVLPSEWKPTRPRVISPNPVEKQDRTGE